MVWPLLFSQGLIHYCLLWPLTSKINRVYPLIKINMSAKFNEDAHKDIVSIAFTRSSLGTQTHWLKHGTTAVLLYPLGNTLYRDNKPMTPLYPRIRWVLTHYQWNKEFDKRMAHCLYSKSFIRINIMHFFKSTDERTFFILHQYMICTRFYIAS